jgi:uncharacterized membrane protein (DUF485 family)
MPEVCNLMLINCQRCTQISPVAEGSVWRVHCSAGFFGVSFPSPLRYNTARSMQKPSSENKLDMHSEAFLHSLMRKQLKLSIACAFAFLVVLLGLPLANYFAPELMATRLWGFTLTWFILGIGFFPAVWCISFYFIRRSIRLEEEEVTEVSKTESGQVGK